MHSTILLGNGMPAFAPGPVKEKHRRWVGGPTDAAMSEEMMGLGGRPATMDHDDHGP